LVSKLQKLWKTEDYWAVWLGLGIVLLALVVYWGGSSITSWAVTPGSWSSIGELTADLGHHWTGYLTIFLLFGIVFTISMGIMGHKIAEYIPGYIILFGGSLVIFYLAGNSFVKNNLHLGAPLLALLIGLVIGNIVKLPEWFQTSLRTEYYIKTGIVLLGATLPLTLIVSAGPIAFVQATIVSVCTWLTIYLAATKFFGLEPQFGAVLGAGGAVCGVSASIAVGGAVKAKKDHIAIGIAVVSVWAIVMILVLSVVVKLMVPVPISPGEAGAWVGTSEFADAGSHQGGRRNAAQPGRSDQHVHPHEGDRARYLDRHLVPDPGRGFGDVLGEGGGRSAGGRRWCDLGAIPQVRARVLRRLDHHDRRVGQSTRGPCGSSCGERHLQDRGRDDRVRHRLLRLRATSRVRRPLRLRTRRRGDHLSGVDEAVRVRCAQGCDSAR
jgi:hypothetical protein